jgi:hypothetical protein
MRDDGELVEMNERGYDTEALLQGYLAHHPDLLAGDQIDSSAPRRWLLVAREAPLASEEDGAGRWAVDHLFLDQDAVPTIVEVKRSTDTRIRREVVGQMLDYAANGVSYWSVDGLRARFEAGSEEHEQALSELLEEPEVDPNEFWQKVKTNLQAGRVRLIFASDKIPDELRRIVEFLNEQMNPAEVLAVEIKQYVSQDSNLRTLVPRVVGQTAKAQDAKSGGARGGRNWDEASFFKVLELNRGPEEAATAAKILEWSSHSDKLPRIEWNARGRHGVFEPCLDHKGTPYWPFGIRTDGQIEVIFQWLKQRPPFTDETKRLELLNRLNEVAGVDLPAGRTIGRPSFPLSVLEHEAALNQFLRVLDWFVLEVRAT